MAEVIKMPKMSDTMTEGVLAKWHKKIGDKISSGDVIAEVETDKATMDLESFQEGELLYIGVEEGKSVPVDSIIAILGSNGEDYTDLLQNENKTTSENKPFEEKTKEKSSKSDGYSESSIITAESLGATVIRMPLLSDTMTEGTINQWYKKIGDTVKNDDTLADVETDKATMEVTAYAEGILLYIGVKEGEAAKVNDIIAVVGKEGTDVTPLLKQSENRENNLSQKKEQSEQKQENKNAAEVQQYSNDKRIKASPLAKKIARDKGIDLSMIQGSAEGGRIIKRDIEQLPESKNYVQNAPEFQLPENRDENSFYEVPVSQMRKAIARRLTQSKFGAPHFYLKMSVNMDETIEARKRMNELSDVKISFNDIIIKAAANALKLHPNINSSWMGDKIRYNNVINIGVAVAVEDGLLVPVIKTANTKSVSEIASQVKDFAQKAKDKKLKPGDWEGSTFTISNLGMFGIDEFTAIINPPDSCILAVGGIYKIPVVKNDQIITGNQMTLTLSCDHRVVDGASGAAFLKTLKGILEEPLRLLI